MSTMQKHHGMPNLVSCNELPKDTDRSTPAERNADCENNLTKRVRQVVQGDRDTLPMYDPTTLNSGSIVGNARGEKFQGIAADAFGKPYDATVSTSFLKNPNGTLTMEIARKGVDYSFKCDLSCETFSSMPSGDPFNTALECEAGSQVTVANCKKVER